MFVFKASTPDAALRQGIHSITTNGVATSSRNGPVLRFPRPVVTEWTKPAQRVSFNTIRDANPFLHLIESLWMLNGRNDVATMAYYAKQMATYTDDETTFNGAYGYRWREHFGFDQLDAVVAELRKNPESRRCVISMWNAMITYETRQSGIGEYDEMVQPDLLNQTSKDLPCNTTVMVDAGLGKLDITVTNRSNDMIWGAYGANTVQFSFLQEYLANKIGIPVGTYYQVSNNMHIYTDFEITKRFVGQHTGATNPYFPIAGALDTIPHYHTLSTHSLDSDTDDFEAELTDFVNRCTIVDSITSYNNSFLQSVAAPMARACNLHKNGDTEGALALLTYSTQSLQQQTDTMFQNDWLCAGTQWLNRRLTAKEQK
jgi:thymidylate synthase